MPNQKKHIAGRCLTLIRLKDEVILSFKGVSECADILNVSRNSVYSLINNSKKSKLLKSYKLINIEDNIKKNMSKLDYINKIKKLNPKFLHNFIILSEEIKSKENIDIECKRCGCKNTIRSDTLYKEKGFCPSCDDNVQYTKETFAYKFYQHYNKNEYKLISEYNTSIKSIKVLHKKCNRIFIKTIEQIFKNKGCKLCLKENAQLHRRSFNTFEDIKNEFQKLNLHKKYNIYETEKYSKIKVYCKKCKIFFYPTISKFLKEDGTRCPNCHTSRGENKISSILKSLNIKFKPQKRFSDCRNKNPLPFDFYLFEYNIIIEFDGELHYHPIEHFGGIESYLKRKKNDLIKNKYCREKSIRIIRIPYWELNNIKKIIYYIKKIGATRI